MSRIACSNRGITIVEVLITLFLTAVGIMALMSMQPAAWTAAGRSDFMGRAAGILQSELEQRELFIMNPANGVTTGVSTRAVNASSQTTTQAGDVPFTVTTTVVPFGASTKAWTVNTRVTWPGNTRGVTGSVIASQQETFRQ